MGEHFGQGLLFPVEDEGDDAGLAWPGEDREQEQIVWLFVFFSF